MRYKRSTDGKQINDQIKKYHCDVFKREIEKWKKETKKETGKKGTLELFQFLFCTCRDDGEVISENVWERLAEEKKMKETDSRYVKALRSNSITHWMKGRMDISENSIEIVCKIFGIDKSVFDYTLNVDAPNIEPVKEHLNENTCIVCGDPIPEGRQVCPYCEYQEFDKINQANDKINHPSHYTYGNIETIDFIYDKGLNFALGNAVKYIVRAGHKHSSMMSDRQKAIEDLEKARKYLEFEIEHLKGDK